MKEQPIAEPMAVPPSPTAPTLNIANVLTVFRLLLVPVFLLALLTEDGTDVAIDNGFGVFNGTSAAAPGVAAVIADIRAARPDLTNDDVRAILVQASMPLEGVAQDYQGAGALDGERARFLSLGWVAGSA